MEQADVINIQIKTLEHVPVFQKPDFWQYSRSLSYGPFESNVLLAY